MAAPTPTTRHVGFDGLRGMVLWHAVWADGTQLTDSVVIDASAIKAGYTFDICRIRAWLSGDIQVVIEHDATADSLIARFDNNADTTHHVDTGEFVKPINDPAGTGYTGDVVLTTTNCAAGDEIMLYIDYEVALKNNS